MADGKKRAQKGRGPADELAAPDERRLSPELVAPQWETREEALVFPAGSAPERPAPGRIALPPSGTADEILGREAGRERQPAPAEPRPAAAHAALEVAPAARTTLSFFGATQGREEAKAEEASEHLATFFLGREEYGVDVRLVQVIIRVSEITPVPRAPEFVRGVINLRGRIIPVVDLKRKLRLGELVPSRASRIVVVKLRERLIGVLVDSASQVLKVPATAIEPAPEEAVEIDARLIRGVAKLEKRLIILIDLKQALQLELRETAAP